MSGGSTGAYTPIPAAPAAPPRLGLLAVIGGEGNEPTLPSSWVNGVAFDPENCLPPADPTWGECPEGEGVDPRVDPGTKVSGDHGDTVQYRPWYAWVGDKCSTLGSRSRDVEAQVRRLYRASESRIMEAELESGTEAQLRGYPNNYLRNSASPSFVNITPGVGASSPLLYALSALQEAIAAGQTGRGMIHATWPTVNLWFAGSALRREGTLILDAFDNIVIPGTGYTGASPDGSAGPPVDPTGETSWAYATGIVTTKRDTAGPQGGIVVTPDELAEAVQRDVNDLEYRAERLVGAWWDACVHAAVNVNLCSTCCEPVAP